MKFFREDFREDSREDILAMWIEPQSEGRGREVEKERETSFPTGAENTDTVCKLWSRRRRGTHVSIFEGFHKWGPHKKYPEFADKQYMHFADRGVRGKKYKYVVDVLYGRPLSCFSHSPLRPLVTLAADSESLNWLSLSVVFSWAEQRGSKQEREREERGGP